ncbi:hypothetical protein ACXJJ3_27440 [Kribbella sp. WER1]
MTRRRTSLVLAVVGVLLVLSCWMDHHDGRALDVGDDGGSMEVGTPVAGRADLYVYAMDVSAREPVDLVTIAPRVLDPGLEFVDARCMRGTRSPGRCRSTGSAGRGRIRRRFRRFRSPGTGWPAVRGTG